MKNLDKIELPTSFSGVPFDSKRGFTLWLNELVTKFPTFDPSWSEETKGKWFNCYGELTNLLIRVQEQSQIKDLNEITNER